MTDDQQRAPVRYGFKPSVAGSPIALELTGQGLSFSAGYRADVWRYADIAQIRLSYRPVSMLNHRFRADLRHRNGRTLRIVSASWAGIVALTPQNDGYRAFIEALHQRIAAERSGVVCLAGLPKAVFVLAVATFAVIMLAILGLAVRAMTGGALDSPQQQIVAALFLLGFAAWSAWSAGGWLLRNKPQRYAPDSVPPRLLP
jgi:hypothetical protein